jgi:hypothetical protein
MSFFRISQVFLFKTGSIVDYHIDSACKIQPAITFYVIKNATSYTFYNIFNAYIDIIYDIIYVM